MPHFAEALSILRDRATDLFGMGRAFASLMQAALSREPGILGDRFSQVWLWHEWPDHEGPDTGIDLVAEEREGGLCAIQRHALRTLEASPKPCRVLDASELDSWDVDWLAYVDNPESLEFQAAHPMRHSPISRRLWTRFARALKPMTGVN